MSYANYHLPISRFPTFLLHCLVSLYIILHMEAVQKTAFIAHRAQPWTQLHITIISQRYLCAGYSTACGTLSAFFHLTLTSPA